MARDLWRVEGTPFPSTLEEMPHAKDAKDAKGKK
jgi:hypothetical protein